MQKEKEMKKLILNIVFIFSIIFCFSNQNVEASSNGKIYTNVKTNVKCGDYVEIPVLMSGCDPMMGMGLDIKYDNTRLKPESVTGTPILSDGILEDSIGTKYDNPFRIVWSNTQAIDLNGKIAVIKFKVIGTGNAKIVISSRGKDTFDEEYNEVTIASCTINLICTCDHSYRLSGSAKKATTLSNGNIEYICKKCGVKTSKIVHKIGSVKLSKTSFVYGKKVNKPKVIVRDSAKKLIASDNYTVKYFRNTKNIGIYKVTITMCGDKYKGTITKKYKVIPPKTKVKLLKATKKKATIGWKKYKKVSGYQIQISSGKKYKKSKRTYVQGKNKTKVTISKVGSGRNYIRVRTYKIVKVNKRKVKIYSKWSKTMRVR